MKITTILLGSEHYNVQDYPPKARFFKRNKDVTKPQEKRKQHPSLGVIFIYKNLNENIQEK